MSGSSLQSNPLANANEFAIIPTDIGRRRSPRRSFKAEQYAANRPPIVDVGGVMTCPGKDYHFRKSYNRSGFERVVFTTKGQAKVGAVRAPAEPIPATCAHNPTNNPFAAAIKDVVEAADHRLTVTEAAKALADAREKYCDREDLTDAEIDKEALDDVMKDVTSFNWQALPKRRKSPLRRRRAAPLRDATEADMAKRFGRCGRREEGARSPRRQASGSRGFQTF